MRNDLISTDLYLGTESPSFTSRRSNFVAYKSGSLYRSQGQHNTRRTMSPSRHPSKGSFGSAVVSRSRVSSKVKLRRRIAVALLITVSVLAVLLPAREAFGGRSLVTSERHAAESSENVTSVVVKSGDSLWSIAKRLEPNKDPREVVDQLSKARQGKPLVVGETITWAK